MARTRQRAKQRKAKRLAQQQKQVERQRKAELGQAVEGRVEQLEKEQIGRESMSGTGAAAEVELAQAEMETELEEAQHEAEQAAVDGAQSQLEERRAEEIDEPSRHEPSRRRRAKTRDTSKATGRGRQARVDRKRKPRERGRVVGFFVDVWAELRRVQWPTRDQVLQATGVVVGFCLVAGAYLALWDLLFNDLVKRLL